TSPGNYTASGGWCQALGGGAFYGKGSYLGRLDFPLAGLNSQPSIWHRGRFRVDIAQGATNNQPHIAQGGYGTPTTSDTITIRAGDVISNQLDFAYCLSEVTIHVHALSGSFSNPRVSQSSGSFSGQNFRGQTDSYSFDLEKASGIPL